MKHNKDKRITFRLTDSEYLKLKKEADKKDISTSELIRSRLMKGEKKNAI